MHGFAENLPMKSLHFFFILLFICVAFDGLARAEEKDKAAIKPIVCCCCGKSSDNIKATDKKTCDTATCCCCGDKGVGNEKEMPKPSYNRKS